MKTDLNTYYVEYRGYVNLYTPILASSIEEARVLADDLPNEPSSTLDLQLLHSDFDFYIDEDRYVMSKPSVSVSVPKKLAKAVVNAAKTQAETREINSNRLKAEQLTKQITEAKAQLLTATKGITDQIEKLQQQLDDINARS